MIKKFIHICTILLCTHICVSGQIAALRGDEVYEKLLSKIGDITKAEQELERQNRVNIELFKRGGDSTAIYRGLIVDMEQAIFDLRARKSVVQNDINTIEQQWMLENLNTNKISKPQPIVEGDDTATSISQSSYAKQTLSVSELQTLHEAELLDKRLELKFGGYISNYRELARLSKEYAQCSTQQVADSIAQKYTTLDSLNRKIAKSGAEIWSRVADNKNFAYTLLVERMGKTDIFDKEQRLKVKAAEMVDSLIFLTPYHELLNYYVYRLSMVEYELLVAEGLQLPEAKGSLKYIRDSLRMAEFNYWPTKIEERLFLDYEPIKFSSKAVYTSSNPIPEGKIYDKGVIYRLLVGSFKSRQAASLFRGASPISIIKDESGLFAYYLGGYQKLSEAESAREVLLKRGFRRPEIVEWRDGEPWNITRSPRVKNVKYRVEIVGISELSPELKSIMEVQCAGRELTKVDNHTFVIGLFDNMQSVESVVESIKSADSTIGVSIIESQVAQ